MTSRKLKCNKHFVPCEASENEEIFRLGIFEFNISRILEHIQNGILIAEEEEIKVEKWLKQHCTNAIKESHLPMVDVFRSVIQAEISPGRFEIIDGNHRLEKAHRDQICVIPSFKVRMEQLVNYFTNKTAYYKFVDYWNSK
jgi:hypothetical protein